MGVLRRMSTCLPSVVIVTFVVTFITLPVLMTAMKLDRQNIMTVDVGEYGGSPMMKDEPPAHKYMAYRILNKINGSIYIGGNETLIRVYLEGGELQTTMETLVTTDATKELVLSCSVLNEANNETVCWNFIRVVEKIPGSNQLLVCGTNAFDRLCYRCNISDTDLTSIECRAGTEPRLNVVPKLPDIRPCSAIFEGIQGIDGGDDMLFAALSGGDDPTLQKYSVPAEGDPVFQLDTVTVRGRFIQKGVVFVGRPFEYTDIPSGNTYVFTFYREPAKEYENHGNKVYSRLSRVCKNDTGDSSRSKKLATFIKARVNCSLPDLNLPFYYDLIQDVIWKEDTKEVYGVFTSEELGPAASALCRYRMWDIMKLFDEGKFKDQEGLDANKLWLPYDTDPVPRPGTCENVHSTVYPPLLDVLVPNYNPIDPSPIVSSALLNTSALPTLYMDGIRFTSLAADFMGDKCVFFFGTTTGSVLKAYKNKCSSPSETFKAVELNFLRTTEPVSGLDLLGEGSNAIKVLVVTGGNELSRWPLGNCSNVGGQNECEVGLGPYCSWKDESCEDEAGVRGQPRLALVQPFQSEITACGMEKVVLYCEANYGVFNNEPFTVNWNKTDDPDFLGNNTHLVVLSQLSTSLLAMEVTVLKNASDGEYTCYSKQGTTEPQNKTVNIICEDCLTLDGLSERCELHKKLEEESKQIKEDFNESQTCSIAVDTCDTCTGR